MFESGISKYLRTVAVVENYFPVDERGTAHVSCKYCRYYRYSSNRCSLTEEPILLPDKCIGGRCPLEEVTE